MAIRWGGELGEHIMPRSEGRPSPAPRTHKLGIIGHAEEARSREAVRRGNDSQADMHVRAAEQAIVRDRYQGRRMETSQAKQRRPGTTI